MQVSITRKDHYWILVYEGNWSGTSPGPLPEVRDALRNSATHIILDFNKIKFLTSGAVSNLEESVEQASHVGAHIGIASPQPGVRSMLKLNPALKSLRMYPDLSQAITKLDLIEYQPESLEEKATTLLICQNKLSIARELREALKHFPLSTQYRLHPTRDLKTAFKTLRKEKVDCIIVDATFNVFKVANFIEQVRGEDYLPSIPILVVASEERLGEADMIIRHGAHELLRFPFKPIEAVIRIENMISYIKDQSPYYPPDADNQPRGYGGKGM